MIGKNYFYSKKYFAYQSAANLNFHEKKTEFLEPGGVLHTF